MQHTRNLVYEALKLYLCFKNYIAFDFFHMWTYLEKKLQRGNELVQKKKVKREEINIF